MKNELKQLYRKIQSKKRSFFPEEAEIAFEKALKSKNVALKKNLGKGIFTLYTGGEKAIKVKILGYK